MNLREILCVLVLVFNFAFLLRVVLSFFPIQAQTAADGVRSLVFTVTEPVVAPIRAAVPPLPGALRGFGVAELILLIGLPILASLICP